MNFVAKVWKEPATGWGGGPPPPRPPAAGGPRREEGRMSAHPMDTAISVPVPVPVPVDRSVSARRSAPAGPVRPRGRSAGWERWWLGAPGLGAPARPAGPPPGLVHEMRPV